MKVFILKQQTYSEGQFGDLELGMDNILGVYSTLELAQQAASKVVIFTFYAQFGSAEMVTAITEHELDSVMEPKGCQYTGHGNEYIPEEEEPYEDSEDYSLPEDEPNELDSWDGDDSQLG